MPEKRTVEKARKARRAGKAPTTAAGEFVREEVHKIRRGEHGARSPEQAIAIGLSKARRAGVKLPPPGRGGASSGTRRKARKDLARSRRSRRTSSRRARAVRGALKREPRRSASRRAISRQARAAARRRSPRSRSQAARKAARTRRR